MRGADGPRLGSGRLGIPHGRPWMPRNEPAPTGT
jgi:hypothetical protein